MWGLNKVVGGMLCFEKIDGCNDGKVFLDLWDVLYKCFRGLVLGVSRRTWKVCKFVSIC